jgi:hypothetical protein
MVAASLALPSSAGATFRQFYSGPVGDGSNNAGVEFHAKFHSRRAFRHGKPPSKVVDFGWFNVPVPPRCSDSSDAPSGFDLRVNDAGRFRGSFDAGNRTAHVTGRFKHRNRKVVGTLRLKGSFSGGCTSADSGTLDWVARHGSGQ